MDDLLESVLDYVRSDYTDYAIMINGEWGAGKTYFWNSQIKRKIESLILNGKKYKTIYMSLYGISNLEEISKKIFIETTQLMDKNLRKYMATHNQTAIPEYAKTSLDMANFFGVSSNGEKMDYDEFFSVQDKVLCFDDLERANVDVIDILGYINNFVEHDHIKTIIICNEKELATKMKSENLEMKTFIATYLLDKQGELNNNDIPMVEKIKDRIEKVFERTNDYERIKEKLIGETFEYAPKFDYIINGILMRYESNSSLVKFLRENSSLIMTTFKRSGTRNLRILKQALNDFKKIYEMTDKFYPNTNKLVLQTMLIFTIAASFEIKAGKITKEKFKNIENNEEYKSILVSSRVLMDNRQFYIKEFDSSYYYNFKADFRFFKFIEFYIRTRIFDMKLFKKDMVDAEMASSGERNMPAYKKLPSNLTEADGDLHYISSNYDSVGLRTGPGTGYNKITSLKKDTLVAVVGWQNGWGNVQLSGGQTGWVTGEYLTKVNQIVDNYVIPNQPSDGGNTPVNPPSTENSNFKIEGNNIIAEPETTVKHIKDKGNNVISAVKDGVNIGDNDLLGTAAVITTDKGTYTVVKLGDVNGDGLIDIIDMALIKRHLTNKTVISGVYYEAAQLDKENNELDIIDMALIKRFLLGKQYISI